MKKSQKHSNTYFFHIGFAAFVYVDKASQKNLYPFRVMR